MSSSKNKDMRAIVRGALSAPHTDPILYASGHEHGLQVFDALGAFFLVSGSASKADAIGKASDTVFKHGALGFMTLDFMTDDRILLRVIELGRAKPAFFSWIRGSKDPPADP